MSIQRLEIKGFRSLRKVSWEPSKLNVIIGPNGSGKSNLLRAIALLQRSAQGDLPNEILSQGGITSLLWDAQAREASWVVKTDPVGEGRDRVKEALTYELHLKQIGNTSSYRVEHEMLGNFYLKDQGKKESPRKFLERRPGHAVTFDFQEHALVAHEGSVPEQQTLLSLVGGPFGNPIVLAFRESVRSWAVYHDVHVDRDSMIRQAAVARLEDRITPDGQNLIPVLHTLYSGNRAFKKLLDSAMQAAFGTDYEELVFPPAADQRVQLRIRSRSLRTEQSAASLSDGTLRFLLLVAILGTPKLPDVVAVDEPEAGLHPSMFPVIAELATAAAERSQVILTTHSADLLDAFKSDPPTATVARFVDGETRLSVVDGQELRRWLKEYTTGALYRTGELEGLA